MLLLWQNEIPNRKDLQEYSSWLQSPFLQQSSQYHQSVRQRRLVQQDLQQTKPLAPPGSHVLFPLIKSSIAEAE
jgi:hypothetical protein